MRSVIKTSLMGKFILIKREAKIKVIIVTTVSAIRFVKDAPTVPISGISVKFNNRLIIIPQITL